MKQVSATGDSSILSSPLYHSINRRKVFSKYRFVILFLAFAMSVVSCQKEELQGNSQKQNSLTSAQGQNILSSSQKRKAVPFKAKFELVIEPFDDTHTRSSGTGEGTHIGRSISVSYIYFVNFPLITGTSTITAANGDKIYSTLSGTVPDPDANGIVWINNLNTITGGTGRFKNATGSFIAHDNVNTGDFTFDGTISY